MGSDPLVFSFFLIFGCSALLATLALFTRQPLIVTYIVTGMLLGPSGLAFIDNAQLINSTAQFGIIFLLFLLGLDMQPAKLLGTLRNSTLVAVASSALFFIAGGGVALAFGYAGLEAAIIGLAMMFSSTIIGIKLLPTTVLHHRHTGEVIISLLLLQDLIAIIVLLALTGGFLDLSGLAKLARVAVSLPLLIALPWLFVKHVLLRLLERFDAFKEYIFLVAIGWCLGLAEIFELAGLSMEIGAFVAGVTLAVSPISLYIAESLKPLRDFFLVLFFFSLGAGFHLALLGEVLAPALVMAGVMLALKPVAFRFLLTGVSETAALGWETGFRLGQISEFSLLIAFIAVAEGLIGQHGSHLIQATAILTFLVSSYLVVFKYPTPIALSEKLRRD